MSAGLPEGYRPVEGTGVRGFAWSAAAPWLESVLHDGGTLEAWATDHARDVLGGGRGPVHVVQAPARGPDDRALWAFRRFRRGGVAATVLGDRYARGVTARPLAELRVSVVARARGVRTPAVVAGATYRSGFIYRADLVTELVPCARTLAASLFDDESGEDPGTALAAAGSMVRALEDARVMHRDLNAANIVLRSLDGGLEPWVLDLDRCSVLPFDGPFPDKAMRTRLVRSLAKLCDRHGRTLTARELGALRTGWEGRA